jgi:hypothetical protein
LRDSLKSLGITKNPKITDLPDEMINMRKLTALFMKKGNKKLTKSPSHTWYVISRLEKKLKEKGLTLSIF